MENGKLEARENFDDWKLPTPPYQPVRIESVEYNYIRNHKTEKMEQLMCYFSFDVEVHKFVVS